MAMSYKITYTPGRGAGLAVLFSGLRYGTDLRSMTQGRGVYAIEFDHYEPLPAHLTDEVIAASKAQEDED